MTSQPNPIVAAHAMITERLDALAKAKDALEACWPMLMPVEVLPPGSVRLEASDPLKQLQAAVAELPKRKGGRPKKASAPHAPAVKAVRQASGRRPRYSADEIQTRILDALGKQKAGIQISRLVSLVGLSQPTVQPVLVALIASGGVVRHGVNAHTRIGLPAVMGAQSVAAPAPAPARARQADASSSIAGEIAAIMADGASHDVSEVYRRCRGRVADLDVEDVAAALEQLAKAGQVDRIPIGEGIVRYRRRAKVKAAS